MSFVYVLGEVGRGFGGKVVVWELVGIIIIVDWGLVWVCFLGSFLFLMGGEVFVFGVVVFVLVFVVMFVFFFVVRVLVIYGVRIRIGLSVGVVIFGNGIKLGWWLLISLIFGRVEVEGRCRWV